MKRNGAGTWTTSCDPTSGDYSFPVVPASGDDIVVFLNHATNKGAAYGRAGPTDVQLEVTDTEVSGEAWPTGTAFTNAMFETFDADHDARIPVDVDSSILTLPASYKLRVKEHTVYQPGGNITAPALRIDRNGTFTPGAILVTLTASGSDTCGKPAGTSMPLCRVAPSVVNLANSTIRYTGTGNTRIESALAFNVLELQPASGSGTFDMTASSLNINAGPSNDLTIGRADGATTAILNRASTGTITVNRDIVVNTNSQLAGSSTSNVIAGNSLTGGGDVDVSGTGAVVLRGTTASPMLGRTSIGASWSFSNLRLENSNGASVRTVSTPAPSAGAGIDVGTITIGLASDARNTTLDLNTNDRALTASTLFNITTRGVVQASNSQPLTMLDSFTSAGSFVANAGEAVFQPITDAVGRLTLSSPITFARLTLTGPGQLEFDNVDQTNVTTNLTASSTGCTAGTRLWLVSDVMGSPWELNATGSASVTNTAIRDSTAVVPIVGSTPTLDAGNNTGWTFAQQAGCGPTAPDSFLTMGAVRPTNVTTATPTYSYVNQTGGAVTLQQTQVYASLPDAVAGLWHFDGSGAAAIGATPASLLSGAVATGSSQPEFGQSLQLDGIDDHASVASTPALQLAQNFTVDAWFRTPALAGARAVIVERSAGTGCATNCNYSIWIDLVNNRVCAGSTSGGVLVSTCSANGSSDALINGAWHHVAFVRSFSGGSHWQTLYVDGAVTAGPALASGPAGTGAAPMTIGRATSGGSHFAGNIDDVRVTAAVMDADSVDGYARAHRPHATALWDSSPTGTGVAIASCSNGVRCANVVYGTGGGSVELRRDGARYYVRARLRAPGNVWSDWGSDWFEMQVTPSISVAPSNIAFGLLTSGVDAVGTTGIQVTTNDERGYLLLASYPSSPLNNGFGDTVPSFVPSPPGAFASVWPEGATSGIGITVLGASGGAASRLPQWGPGTGTSATDYVNNYYAGLAVGTMTMLHRRTSMYAGPDTVNLAVRMNVSSSQPAGLYTGTIAVVAVANP